MTSGDGLAEAIAGHVEGGVEGLQSHVGRYDDRTLDKVHGGQGQGDQADPTVLNEGHEDVEDRGVASHTHDNEDGEEDDLAGRVMTHSGVTDDGNVGALRDRAFVLHAA